MNKLKGNIFSKEGVLLIVFIVLFAIFSLLSPDKFFSLYNIESMAFQLPELAILSIAMMIVILTGGINLAVTTICALSGIVAGYFLGNFDIDPTILILISTVVAIVVGAICGYINGIFISKIGITPILATLGTMTLFEGIGLNFTKGGALGNFPFEFMVLGNDSTFGIPNPFIILILIALIMGFILEKTSFGLKVYMIGSNEKATFYSGINTKKILMMVYVVSGILSGIASLIIISRYNSAKVDYGASYLLLTITASVLGGTNINGGYGKIYGTIIATMILQILTTGMTLLGINRFLVDFVLGSILIITILIQYYLNAYQNKKKKESMRVA